MERRDTERWGERRGEKGRRREGGETVSVYGNEEFAITTINQITLTLTYEYK